MSRLVADVALKEGVKASLQNSAPIVVEMAGAAAEAYDKSFLGRVHAGMGDFEGMPENPTNPLHNMPRGAGSRPRATEASTVHLQKTPAQIAIEQQPQLRAARKAHEEYVAGGEKPDSPEALRFTQCVGTLMDSCAKNLSGTAFAPFGRVLSTGSNAISGIIAARTAGTLVAKWAGSAAFGAATAGIGYALTAFSAIVSLLSSAESDGSAERHQEIMHEFKTLKDGLARSFAHLMNHIDYRFMQMDAKLTAQHQSVMRELSEMAQDTRLGFHYMEEQSLRRYSALTDAIGEIQTQTNALHQQQIRLMEDNFRREYGQLEQFSHLETQLDRRAVNAARIAMRRGDLKEFDRFAKELHQAIVAESTGSPNLTGSDIDLTKSDAAITARITQPLQRGVAVKHIASNNTQALMRYAVSLGALTSQELNVPNLTLVRDRAFAFLELYRANAHPLTEETAWYLQNVIEFLEKQFTLFSAVNKEQLFASLKAKIKRDLTELKRAIQAILAPVQDSAALMQARLVTLDAIERRIDLSFDAKARIPIPARNQQFIDQVMPYANQSDDKRNSYYLQNALDAYWAAHYPHEVKRMRNNAFAFEYVHGGYIAIDVAHAIGYGKEYQDLNHESRFRSICENVQRPLQAYRAQLTSGVGYQSPGLRVFSPLSASSGSIDLPFYAGQNSSYPFESLLSKFIPQKAFELEFNGYGTMRLTYDATDLVSDSMSVVLKATFEPFDSAFPVVNLFEIKPTTAIIASLYPNKDVALYNWWHHFVYAHDTTKTPIKLTENMWRSDGTRAGHGMSFPPLYTVSYTSPMQMLLELKENPNLLSLQQRLTAMEQAILLKEKTQREQKIKALSFAVVEKNISALILYAALFAQESPLAMSHLSRTLEEGGVTALLNTIDELITRVSAFELTGAATELPFLIEQLHHVMQAKAELGIAPAEQVTTERAEAEGYQRGLELGNTLALSVIIAGLTQAGHADAARLLSSDQPSRFIVDQDQFSASEKRGLLQSVSNKVLEVVPRLAQAQQIPAIIWLTQFSHAQITQSLQSQGVSRALLGEREEEVATTATASRATRTPAMFGATPQPGAASQFAASTNGVRNAF